MEPEAQRKTRQTLIPGAVGWLERQAVHLPVRMQALGESAGSGAEHGFSVKSGSPEAGMCMDAGEALRVSRAVGSFFMKALGCQLQELTLGVHL